MLIGLQVPCYQTSNQETQKEKKINFRCNRVHINYAQCNLIGFCFYSECPPDKIELGKATWTLLHTMAAYYPIHPTLKQQEDMKKFLQIFPQFFPCRPCAYDFESSKYNILF